MCMMLIMPKGINISADPVVDTSTCCINVINVNDTAPIHTAAIILL